MIGGIEETSDYSKPAPRLGPTDRTRSLLARYARTLNGDLAAPYIDERFGQLVYQ